MRMEVSPGEAADKLTILQIKRERITDPGKRSNIARAYELLAAAFALECGGNAVVAGLCAELKRINETLWQLENAVREHERSGDFGSSFVERARAIYRINDERSAVKRRIDETLGSTLTEEKFYTPY